DCVAYDYDVFQEKPRAGDDELHDTYRDIAYTGMALCPCAVETRIGRVRLFGFPTLEYFEENFSDKPSARASFVEYAKNTTFERAVGAKKLGIVSKLADFLGDVDGSARQDFQLKEVDSLEGYQFAEKVVKVGQSVVAFGRYSLEKGGIVNHMGF